LQLNYSNPINNVVVRRRVKYNNQGKNGISGFET